MSWANLHGDDMVLTMHMDIWASIRQEVTATKQTDLALLLRLLRLLLIGLFSLFMVGQRRRLSRVRY